ncbi:UNC-like C-terminal-domain-containing protein [Dichomitus squalens]|uniref:UNC-like C-terminal-domain-containing protein n=1 Tax=Dichomitus squalens TaxID=114155 RepID=A0A4Q9M5W0_9APHY|nr:UNC-like C-terminal-domain-containing protein [Dichomitus squalens]
MFSLLPTSLLALLYAAPAFAAPQTPNDAFHALAVHGPKPPEEPVCCLRPLPPLQPPAEEDTLLSFEDWKAKQLGGEVNPPPVHRPPENLSVSTAVVPPDSSHPSSTQTKQPVQVDVQEHGAPQERVAPQMRIPLTDRFNYASLDCSARVHAAHKSAKSASSILSSKKDRYMLSPCEEKRQFVIVELCDDIRIDTVQLANYEFFSGVFKDFSVSVAKQYTTDPKEWVPAGTYRAKNVRGVQSFHPPATLRDFYRVIRIDFHSHYGSEYYCPLSLLRVYGLTQLEEWQWETWEAESRAKRSVEEASPLVEVVAEPPKPVHVPLPESAAENVSHVAPPSDAAAGERTAVTVSPAGHIPVTANIPSSLQHILTKPSFATDVISPQQADASSSPNTEHQDVSHESSRLSSDPVYHTPVSLSSTSTLTHAHSTASDNHSSSTTSIFIDLTDSGSASHSTSSSSSSSSASSRSSVVTTDGSSSLATLSPSYIPPPAPVSTGGESIYRTIMNRLTALEAKTTLYTRYVEEQTTGMRDVLRRLTEDLGRLEGIGKAQAQLYQRSVVELEKQTRRLEDEQRELVHRVNYLTDEVILEKRLGIAQLCLLLIVLIFMALTRGSRGEYAPPPGTRASVRDWGRRTLSFSGDLVNRLRARSSTPPRPVSGSNQKPGENEIVFPSIRLGDEQPRPRRSHAAGSSRKGSSVRPHTPTALRTPTNRHFTHHRVPASPGFLSGVRPGIQRSNSGSMTHGFGGVGPVPKSAKRWARSAHLHEVKATSASPRGQAADGEATPIPSTDATPGADAEGSDVHVLLAPPLIERSETVRKGKGKAPMVRHPSPLRPLIVNLSSPLLRPAALSGEGSEGEGWVDTDVSGSECDVVLDAGPDSAALRERTFVRATNSSL